MKKLNFTWMASGLFFLGLITYLSLNSFFNVWSDEIFSLLVVKKSWGHMLEIILTEDSHPPLYYLLLKGWSELFGYSVFAARILSMLGVFLLAGLGLGPIKRLLGEKTALIFIALALFMPFSLRIGLDIRMYSFACFFTTATFVYAALIAFGSSQKSDWFKLTGFALAAMYTHHYAMASVFFLYGGLFFFFLIQKRSALVPYFLSATFLSLCYLPELYFLIRHTINSKETLILSLGFLQNSFRVFLIPVPFTFMNLIFLVCAMMACGWITWFCYLMNRTQAKSSSYKIALFALLLVVIVVVWATTLSLVFRPIVSWRYYLPLMGIMCLGWSIALSKEKRLAIIFAVLFSISFVTCYIQKNTTMFDETQRHINAYITKNIKPDDLILANSLTSYFHALYFFPTYTVRLDPELAKKQLMYLKEDLHVLQADDLKNKTVLYSFEDDFCSAEGASFMETYNGQKYCISRVNFLLEKK